MTTPYEDPDAYDVIVLGTMTSPGVVTLSGHDRDKNWDTQAAKGKQGATEILNGDPILEFTATFALAGDEIGADSDDFSQWAIFKRLIESTTNGPTPVALPIYHPDLAEQRVTEVVLGSMGGGKHDGKGGKTYAVKFREYKPPKPKPTVKAIAKPGQGTAAASAPDPNAAAKAQLAGLLAQAQAPPAP
jgi:hypothetical protein